MAAHLIPDGGRTELPDRLGLGPGEKISRQRAFQLGPRKLADLLPTSTRSDQIFQPAPFTTAGGRKCSGRDGPHVNGGICAIEVFPLSVGGLANEEPAPERLAPAAEAE